MSIGAVGTCGIYSVMVIFSVCDHTCAPNFITLGRKTEPGWKGFILSSFLKMRSDSPEVAAPHPLCLGGPHHFPYRRCLPLQPGQRMLSCVR